MILIDDPLNRPRRCRPVGAAPSTTGFDGMLYPRLNDKTNGAIVIFRRRLHEDDLVGPGRLGDRDVSGHCGSR
ncbi:MAG: hypothetical protein JO288_00950 [Hyphomicrobiales bacterium]|nr:hypothetical protein [Hyphomicrobiales bacterium]